VSLPQSRMQPARQAKRGGTARLTSSVHDRVLDPGRPTKFVAFLLDLNGEFARWCQNENDRTITRLQVRLQQHERIGAGRGTQIQMRSLFSTGRTRTPSSARKNPHLFRPVDMTSRCDFDTIEPRRWGPSLPYPTTKHRECSVHPRERDARAQTQASRTHCHAPLLTRESESK
jgi:hypothetical protein